jgi:hypothetical protein
VDAFAVRYYDANTDGVLAENNDGLHYYMQDANFNVTAITNNTGTVLERYGYSPYGEVTFLNPDFTVKALQTSAIANTHLYTGRESRDRGECKRWVTVKGFRLCVEWEFPDWRD